MERIQGEFGEMKAVLVIEMPHDCVYCPCWRGGNDEFPFDDCTALQRPLTVEERDNKPDWCPLKPMPEKRELHQYVGDRCYHCRFFNGEKSTVGIACTNPMKEWRTRTAKYKQPSMKACKMFERKQGE